MNRKQKRAYAKNYGTELTLEKVKQEGIVKGRKEALDLILTMMVYTLDYKLELSSEKLVQIVDDIMLNIDSFRTNHLTHSDFLEIKKQLAKKGIILK